MPVSSDTTLPPDTPAEPEKRFSLTFSMENAAFQARLTASEILKILGQVSGQVATGRFSGSVHDSNGNTVGEFRSTWRADPPAVAVKRAKVLKSK